MLASFRAELLKLRRRPAVWVLGGILVVYVVFLGYLPAYLEYVAARSDAGEFRMDIGIPPLLILLQALPGELVRAVMNFVMEADRPVGIVLGALVAGSEYGWGTYKTALAQRPPRLSVYFGKVLALGVVLAAFVLAFYATAAGASLAVAAVEGPRIGALSEEELAEEIADPNFPAFTVAEDVRRGLAPPDPLELLRGLGASWLILAASASLGLMLATLFRSAALGMGGGLAFMEIVDDTIGNFGPRISEALGAVAEALPGANTLSLLVSFGQPGGGPDQTVLAVGQVDAVRAVLVLTAYTLAFVAAGAILFRTRELV